MMKNLISYKGVVMSPQTLLSYQRAEEKGTKTPQPPLMRWDVINHILGGAGRYLEIGVQRGVAGKQIVASEKWGIDPAPMEGADSSYNKLVRATSDEFFSGLDANERFDVVFIDGLHQAEQVYRDVQNSLKHLADNGVIVMHDCNPSTEAMQRRELQPGQWTGDCWKTVARLRAEHGDLQVHVIDTDFGLGIVRRGPSKLIALEKNWIDLSWSDLDADRERLLGLVPQSHIETGQRRGRSILEALGSVPFLANWRVVIPSNSAKRLRRAVASILGHHPQIPPEWIVVVDDGAKVEWRPDDPSVSWAYGVKPFIYSRNVNIGIRAAGPYDIVVMGDDVEVQTPNAFNILRSQKAVVSPLIAGPVGNPLQSHRPNARKRVVVEKQLAFVCVYLPHPVLDKVGKLDERFVRYGAEDSDFCWRAQEEGFDLEIDGRVLVRHNAPGMESAFRGKTPHPQGNRELLRAKWPNKQI